MTCVRTPEYDSGDHVECGHSRMSDVMSCRRIRMDDDEMEWSDHDPLAENSSDM